MSLDFNKQNKIHKKSIAIKTLYLIDDSFNTFDHVIDCLVAICDHTPIQAEQCALLTHINGKCDILRGEISELKPLIISHADSSRFMLSIIP